MADKDIVTIEKLNDDNFEFWKFSMSLLFEKKEIKDVVDGNAVKPEEMEVAAYKGRGVRGTVMHAIISHPL